MATIYGALRVRNEQRWIQQVIRSIKPVCAKIFVLDDRSEDETANICEAEGCIVYRDAVPWVKNSRGELVSDESAGKDFLLQKMYDAIPKEDQHYTYGNYASPYWCLAVDGDEELVQADIPLIQEAAQRKDAHAIALKILYLWDKPNQWRVDGVYGNFRRPSLFRLMNSNFRYQRTTSGDGANLHCSSIPQEMLHHSRKASAHCEARLLHWGYFDRELRLKKYAEYNEKDRNNETEDCYRHMVQGDIPEVPAHWRKGIELKHAGPLELRPL